MRSPGRLAWPAMEIDWASNNWIGVAGLATTITALVAIVTLIRAGRDSRDRTRPVVIAEYRRPEFGFNTLLLTVKNVGMSLARNVRVTFEPPLQADGNGLSVASMVKDRYSDPIPVMGQGQELINAVHFGAADRDLPQDLTVTIEYDRGRFRRHHDTFRLLSTVHMLETVVQASDSPTGRLKEIRDQLKGQTQALNSIRTAIAASNATNDATPTGSQPPSLAAQLWARLTGRHETP